MKIQYFFLLGMFLLIQSCGGSSSGDDDNNVEQSVDDVSVFSDQSLSESLTFIGADKINSEFISPQLTTGGTLTLSNKLAITSGGSSAFTIEPNLAEGDKVLAYLYSIPNTNLTSVVYPEIADIDSTSFQQDITAASMVLDENYTTDLLVQAYILPATEEALSFTDIDEFWSTLNLSSDYWTEPTTIELSAIKVGEGQVQITLTWDSEADLDLHIIEPSGNDINWQDPVSQSGDGYLDIDNVYGFGPENVYFTDQYESGTYQIQVHHFSGDVPTNYTITVKNANDVDTYSGVLSTEEEIDIVTDILVSGTIVVDTESETNTDETPTTTETVTTCTYSEYSSTESLNCIYYIDGEIVSTRSESITTSSNNYQTYYSQDIIEYSQNTQQAIWHYEEGFEGVNYIDDRVVIRSYLSENIYDFAQFGIEESGVDPHLFVTRRKVDNGVTIEDYICHIIGGETSGTNNITNVYSYSCPTLIDESITTQVHSFGGQEMWLLTDEYLQYIE